MVEAIPGNPEDQAQAGAAGAGLRRLEVAEKVLPHGIPIDRFLNAVDGRRQGLEHLAELLIDGRAGKPEEQSDHPEDRDGDDQHRPADRNARVVGDHARQTAKQDRQQDPDEAEQQGGPDAPQQQGERHDGHDHQSTPGPPDERVMNRIIHIVDWHSTPARSGAAPGNPWG